MSRPDLRTRRQAGIAQVALALVALVAALLYPLLPMAAHQIGMDMVVPHLVVPYAAAGCIAVVAIHVFLLAVWRIVRFISTGKFYEQPVLKWMTVAQVAVVIGCLMPVGVGLHLGFVENAGGPLVVPMVFGVVVLVVAALALLGLLVGLYRDASENVAELAEVI